MKKLFDHMPPEVKHPRFEVWISIPSKTFQSFEFTRNGLQEILSPMRRPGSREVQHDRPKRV